MDSMYKKKSLKFSGFSKEIKNEELLYRRKMSRQQQHSVLRVITEKSEENETNTPKVDLKTTKIPSRLEMLKKWKEEKLLKQQRQKQMKKPPFIVGVVPKVITPSIPIFYKVCNKPFGSKSKVSQIPKPASTTSKFSLIPKFETSSQKSVSSTVKSSQLKNTHSMKIASLKPIQKPLSLKLAYSKSVKPKKIISNDRKSGKNLDDKFGSTTENLVDNQTSQKIFDCDISHIEPRKSFAPENFQFCTPVKLDISVFDIEGPSAIFLKGKMERERTSTPLKETNQKSKQVKSSKTPSLKGANDSLSTLLKETDQIPSIPVNNRYHSTRSSTLKETNQNFKYDSVEKINEADVCQKQTSPNVDIKELNILDKLTSDKELVLEALNDKNSMNININSVEIFSFGNGTLEKVQKQSKNDSLESDKLIAEHGDEPLDTFLIVPEASLKEKDLNLPETRQSMKPTGALQTKSKLSLKPNLESIRDNSEDKHHLEIPKSSKRSTKEINFTPRRSARLAEKFRRNELASVSATALTYDLDNLHLQDTPIAKREPEVSLLYTPITRGRPSTRKSIKKDLMSFSPFD